MFENKLKFILLQSIKLNTLKINWMRQKKSDTDKEIINPQLHDTNKTYWMKFHTKTIQRPVLKINYFLIDPWSRWH